MADRETTRSHLLLAMGDIEGLATRLTVTGPMASGLANARMMLDRRAFLATELDWGDRRAALAIEHESDVLTAYRLLVAKALVLSERSLATYPTDDPEAAGEAGEALGEIVSLRPEVERLSD